ncbi:MAG: flagellar biosynthetic protein FliR, partial [Bdellovibrionales bacterium]
MLIGQVFTEAQVILFALVWLRMVSFVLSAAFFSSPSVNVPVKILLSVVLTAIVAPMAQFHTQELGELSNSIIMMSLKEVAVGLILGFLTRFFFFALSMA